jgi:hypothetical protein
MEKIEKIVVSRTSRKNVMVFGIKSPFDIEILSCTNEDISVYMRSNISLGNQSLPRLNGEDQTIIFRISHEHVI